MHFRQLFLFARVNLQSVFENKVLRRLFGPNRDEVTGDWRRLRVEELNDLYSSRNIFWVMISRRKEWAEYVTHMGRREGFGGRNIGKGTIWKSQT